MGNNTKNLNLYKTNMDTDGSELFDFDRDLNENWDKIDEAFENVANTDLSNLSPEGAAKLNNNNYTPACVNYGNTDTSGKGDLAERTIFIPDMTSATTPKGTVTTTGYWDTTNHAFQAFGSTGAVGRPAGSPTAVQGSSTTVTATYTFDTPLDAGAYNLTAIYSNSSGSYKDWTNLKFEAILEDSSIQTTYSNASPGVLDSVPYQILQSFVTPLKIVSIKFTGVSTIAGTTGATIGAVIYGIQISNNTIKLKAGDGQGENYVPIIGTNASRKRFEINTALSFVPSGYVGSANLAINNGVLEQIGNIYSQQAEPDFVLDNACILETPKDITYTTTSYTVPKGLKYLIPQEDNKYLIRTIQNDIVNTYVGNGVSPVFYYITADINGELNFPRSDLTFRQATQPTITTPTLTNFWYDTSQENKFWKILLANTSVWLPANLAFIGEIHKASATTISSVVTYTPHNGYPAWLDFSFSTSQNFVARKMDENATWQGWGGTPILSSALTDGVVSGVSTFPFKQNGYEVNTQTEVSVGVPLARSIIAQRDVDISRLISGTMPFTAPNSGKVYLTCTIGGNSTNGVYIDGIQIHSANGVGGYTSTAPYELDVSKGRVVSIGGNNISVQSCKFAPYKGV